jgi:hypothetical protein
MAIEKTVSWQNGKSATCQVDETAERQKRVESPATHSSKLF